MNNLADSYRLQGKYARAEALLKQTLEIQSRVLGPEHHDAADSMQNLARVYYSESKYAQAEALFSQSLKIQRRVSGPEHPDTLETAANLTLTYQVQGKFAASEALAREIGRSFKQIHFPNQAWSKNCLCYSSLRRFSPNRAATHLH
jgi:tetratricopeptide (TPR) repeat protein